MRLPANHNNFIKHNSYYLSFVVMVLKCRRNYLKTVGKTFIMLFKEKGSKANLFSILDHCKIDDNKLNSTNISNMEDNSQIWF